MNSDIIFSKGFPTIKLVCYTKYWKDSNWESDIKSLWKDQDNYYAFYCMSGLRPITDRLFNEVFNNYKIENNE